MAGQHDGVAGLNHRGPENLPGVRAQGDQGLGQPLVQGLDRRGRQGDDDGQPEDGLADGDAGMVKSRPVEPRGPLRVRKA